MEFKDVVKLAQDYTCGRMSAEFSDAQINETALREELIKLNGGSTDFSIKNFYRGSAIFSFVEEVIPTIIHEGLKGDEFFFNLVDYRNEALKDQTTFWTHDKMELVVSKIGSYGTQGIRRQRLGRMSSYTIETSVYYVKIYDEFERFMAGKVDWAAMCMAITRAMLNKLRMDIYNAFVAVSATTHGLNSKCVVEGTYDEDELLTVGTYIEAANDGSKVMYLGTKKALAKMNTTVVSDKAKNDMYDLGYYGKFHGSDCAYMAQRIKPGTDEFMFDDNKIFIIPLDQQDKPIKVVDKGVGYLTENTANDGQTGDLTQNYTYGQAFGIGLVFNSKMGFYTITA